MSLIALQRDFRAALLGAADQVIEPGLAVYHNAYRVQLSDCLRETFPQLRKWLGDDEFIEAALAHIERVPPNSWTLGHYGEGLDATLSRLYPDDGEVAELAWLEWQLSLAFAGPDAGTPDAASLAATDWDNARLRFVPTLRSGIALTNAGAIWSALAADREPPAAEPLPEPATMIVWRNEFSPSFRTVDDREWNALERMLAGDTFGALCQDFVARLGPEDGVEAAGTMLGQWLRDGMIAEIE